MVKRKPGHCWLQSWSGQGRVGTACPQLAGADSRSGAAKRHEIRSGAGLRHATRPGILLPGAGEPRCALRRTATGIFFSGHGIILQGSHPLRAPQIKAEAGDSIGYSSWFAGAAWMPGAVPSICCNREEHRRGLFSSCADWPGVHFMNRGRCLKQTEPLPTQPGTSIDTVVSSGSFARFIRLVHPSAAERRFERFRRTKRVPRSHNHHATMPPTIPARTPKAGN